MEKIIFRLIIILFLGVIYPVSNQYEIYLGNLFVAEVEISSNEIYYNNILCNNIEYTSRTQSIFEYIYPVINKYQTIVDKNNNQILKYDKNIDQLNLNENLSTFRVNDTTFYSSNNFITPKAHNIFSLLDYLSYNPLNVIDNTYVLDRDGESYEASFKLVNEDSGVLTLKMDIKSNSLNDSNKKYDIFLWGLYLNGYDKYIWIDTKKNKITRCEFKNSLVSLNAYLL